MCYKIGVLLIVLGVWNTVNKYWDANIIEPRYETGDGVMIDLSPEFWINLELVTVRFVVFLFGL